MDHMMPEMDGIETFHRIREKGGSYYTSVPIVALTANAIAGAREMFLEEGFNDFVEKPVDISVLERVLQRNLPDGKLDMVEVNAALPEDTAEEPREQAIEVRPGSSFIISDLDVESGQTYCGGREAYLEILKEYARKGEENWTPIEELYEKQDWKNYTISVHAVKSSMLAIGAKHLSELAKKLEAAGKADNISYIRENHAAMIEEFRRVIGEITKSGFVDAGDVTVEETGDLPVLTDEEFEQKAIEFEDAMYEFDGMKMSSIAKELSGCVYHGTALKEPLAGVFHKIEMSDYMAAVEVVLKLKDKLKNDGEEE
jgi:HPt (histidine-containing phosphotransfer) domain-containing protein